GVMLSRVRAGLKLADARVFANFYEQYGNVLVHLGTVGELSLEPAEQLHDVLNRLCESLGWSRLALFLYSDETARGMIAVAASDDPAGMKIPIGLKRYPEVRAALEQKQPVLVEDAGRSALLGEWASLAAEKGGKALLAVPLMVDRKPLGALLYRHEQ